MMSIPVLDPLLRDVLHMRIQNEPTHRISKAQRDSLLAIALQDPQAVVEGLDWKFRPVVRAKASGPGRKTRYALQKNGAATPIDWGGRNRLAEEWS